MTILEIIELVILAVVVVGMIIYYGVKIIKQNLLNQVIDVIKKSIKEAEQSGKTGEEKQQYVLDQVAKCCEDLKIPFNLIKTLVVKLIKEIVAGYNTITK